MYYSYAGAARVSACFALFFEEYSLVEFCKAKATIDYPSIVKIDGVEEVHSLILFLKKRIPCSCPDVKYEHVM